ncbi:MAG: hypothetical protein IJ840_06755 [Bacteroidales bacterium]|nr:hypothetical protein [Bacteroidales bacterium]
MKTKVTYIAPDMESVILVKEAVMLNDSQFGDEGKAGQTMTYNRYNEDF